jgi:hypothetical protein
MQNNSQRRAKIEFSKFYIPLLFILIPAFIYAFTRYTLHHNEPWYDLPFYLLNKVIGVTSVIMMSCAYVIGPLVSLNNKFKSYLGHRKYLGVGGFFLASSHGFMSLLLMNPNNYKVFYNLETSRLNWVGSFSMLFGTIAIVHFLFIAITSLPPIVKEMHSKQWKEIQKGGMIALWISFTHIAVFGYQSWFNLDKWYGGMPPFSLIGAISIVFILSIRYLLIFYKKYKRIPHYQNTILKDNL